MKSSSGQHYVALDHARALAIFFVVAWHFVHGTNGSPTPFNQAPIIFPLALFDEGHTGVALFMTLSGYLFAKLLDGRSIRFSIFFYNRILRLGPLLVFIVLLDSALSDPRPTLPTILDNFLAGFVRPVWPNGAWSITVELHFYLLLPLLLTGLRTIRAVGAAILLTILLRARLWSVIGEVQGVAYWSLIGRIDQFLCGICAFYYRRHLTKRHALALSTIIGFSAFYWWFDWHGGFYNMPTYPSPSPLWIILPTIEGVSYAIAISWYENSFTHQKGRMSDALARIGQYSYSIYLWHLFFVFRAAEFVDKEVMSLANFYWALMWSVGFMILMVPVGHLSYRIIEEPFLRLRRVYIRPKPVSA